MLQRSFVVVAVVADVHGLSLSVGVQRALETSLGKALASLPSSGKVEPFASGRSDFDPRLLDVSDRPWPIGVPQPRADEATVTDSAEIKY